jgi:NAD(P)-dependent dehydrogenase (short-subunit alcohol dehydrogenase family)
MQARGGGYLLITASAAGLLTMIDNAPYSVTKYAAVGLAEWLAVTYGDEGVGVSCLCPEVVRTGMTAWAGEERMPDGAIDPEVVADVVVEGLHDERFLILPHPRVAEYVKRKADDHERWLRGMRRLRAKG